MDDHGVPAVVLPHALANQRVLAAQQWGEGGSACAIGMAYGGCGGAGSRVCVHTHLLLGGAPTLGLHLGLELPLR